MFFRNEHHPVIVSEDVKSNSTIDQNVSEHTLIARIIHFCNFSAILVRILVMYRQNPDKTAFQADSFLESSAFYILVYVHLCIMYICYDLKHYSCAKQNCSSDNHDSFGSFHFKQVILDEAYTRLAKHYVERALLCIQYKRMTIIHSYNAVMLYLKILSRFRTHNVSNFG